MTLKRTFDIAAALLVAIPATPIVLGLAFASAVVHKQPAFFSQQRVGKDGKIFKIYKVRSMRDEFNEAGEALPDEERVTKFGKFIRSYRVDELPQLLNVVKGDMLLIGPRPALVPETDQYSMNARQRLAAMPGLTGLWQVSGRADTTFEEQVALDIRYVREKSWIEDLRILLATVPVVLFGKGAY